MEVFFDSLISQPWYLSYLSGILLFLVSSIFLVIPLQIRRMHHFSCLISSFFLYGISRLGLSLCLILEIPFLSYLQQFFQLLSFLFAAEFMRRNWKKAFGFELSAMIHFPLTLILLVVLFLAGDLSFGLGGIAMLLLGSLLLFLFFRGVQKNSHPRLSHIGFVLLALQLILFLQFFLGFHGGKDSSGAIVTLCRHNFSYAHLFQPFALILICVFVLLVRTLHGRLQKVQGEAWGMFSPVIFVILLLIVNFSGAVFTKVMIHREGRRVVTGLERSKEALEKLIQQRMLFASTSSSLMSSTPALADYLDQPDPARFAILERLFKSFAENFPDGICYVMNKDGLVLASSGKQELFVGRFLNFRSYFKAAMAGKNGILIDYGKFTNELGFYSSHPVKRPSDNEIIGVCAVKRNMNDLIGILNLYRESLLIDASGKVFLASNPEYVGKTLVFQDKDRGSGSIDENEPERLTVSAGKYFYSKFALDSGDWNVVLLSSSASLNSVKIWSFSFFSIFSLVFIAFFIGNEKKEELLLAHKSAESRFESVLFNAPEGILIISPQDQKILLANRGFERMFELAYNPAGKFYYDFLPPERTNFQKVAHFPEDGSFLNEREFVRPGKGRFFAEIKGSSTSFNGQVAIIMFLRDISQRIVYENKLQQAKSAAENASRVKSRFLADTSHEIRTPLTAIIGLNEMARKLCGSEEQKKLLELASATSRSLLEILNDILDLSQAEAGVLKIVAAPFNLRFLLEKLLEVIKIRSEEKQLAIELNIDERIPATVISDKNRLRQILSNLLNNSLRNTETGRISVEAILANEDKEKIDLQILIKDTGRGLTEKVKQNFSGQFKVASVNAGDEETVADMELSFSRRVLEKLGGCLILDVDQADGALWRIELPVQKVQPGDPVIDEIGESVEKLRLSVDSLPLKILIADDNETNLFLASSIITEFKGQPDCAHDGLEAMEMIEKKTYDLALLDIMMPNLDGLETIRRIRNLSTANAKIPIIALSAFSTIDEREKAMAAGANHYLAKPYFPNDLLRAIKKVFDRRLDFSDLKSLPEADSDKSLPVSGKLRLKQVNLKELEVRILQKPENIRQINDIYSKRSQVLTEALAECIKDGDVAKLRETAHSVKGLAGMLAATKVFAQAQVVEQLAREGKFEDAVEMVPVLVTQINQISEDLAEICKSLNTF